MSCKFCAPKVMRTGVIYRMKKKCYYYDKDYPFAKPAPYADNCDIGDCWLVNNSDKVNPEYSESPVPMNIKNLMVESIQREGEIK